MGRPDEAATNPLLKGQSEQNIGNSTTLRPQEGAATVIPQTNPPRLVQLLGGSGAGQTTSIIYTASRIVGQDNPNPGFPGPVTGILEFGNGGRSTRVEFDVPVGPFVGTITTASNAVEPQDGGAIVTVPTGVVRAYMRYDNLLLAPLLQQTPPVSLAQLMGVAVQGPGGPRANVPAEPLLGKAMVNYFSRHFTKTYKTLYCYTGPAPVQVGIAYVYYALPAFTKSFRIVRIPSTSQLDVQIRDNVQLMEAFTLGSGASPVIDVIGNEAIVGIQSRLAADTVTFLALVCEVGV
jgi:hypothetical protein